MAGWRERVPRLTEMVSALRAQVSTHRPEFTMSYDGGLTKTVDGSLQKMVLKRTHEGHTAMSHVAGLSRLVLNLAFPLTSSRPQLWETFPNMLPDDGKPYSGSCALLLSMPASFRVSTNSGPHRL